MEQRKRRERKVKYRAKEPIANEVTLGASFGVDHNYFFQEKSWCEARIIVACILMSTKAQNK
jgi:hypothetical protein